VAAIDRGLLSFTEASSIQEDYLSFSHSSVRVEVVAALVEHVCDNNLRGDLGTLCLLPAYHAGQDLILADQKELALKLYQRFEIPFEHWKGLSNESRDKIKIFLESEGTTNPFGNYLLM